MIDKLGLYWYAPDNSECFLGALSKSENTYHFKFSEENYKKAVSNGCCGLCGLDISMDLSSPVLFPFFESRIPQKDSFKIDEFLQKIGLTQYDDMEILARTGARLFTDKFFVKSN